jgi:hypothetical protein
MSENGDLTCEVVDVSVTTKNTTTITSTHFTAWGASRGRSTPPNARLEGGVLGKPSRFPSLRGPSPLDTCSTETARRA